MKAKTRAEMKANARKIRRLPTDPNRLDFFKAGRLGELKRWVLDNSMLENQSNLTAAGIIDHISMHYKLKVNQQ